MYTWDKNAFTFIFYLNLLSSKEKLAKKLAGFQQDEIKYNVFWHKMDKWMKDNAERVEEIFKHQEHEDEGWVPHNYFKAGQFTDGFVNYCVTR